MPDKWMKVKRLLAIITSILLWVISIIFSYKGFNLDTGSSMAWMGIVMAFSVTVLELIFNTNTIESLTNQRANFGEYMLIVGGFLAYIFDIWTNILGLYAARSLPAPTFSTMDLGFIVPLLVGAFMAILPEPLFIWGIMSYAPVKNMGRTLFGLETEIASRLPRRK